MLAPPFTRKDTLGPLALTLAAMSRKYMVMLTSQVPWANTNSALSENRCMGVPRREITLPTLSCSTGRVRREEIRGEGVGRVVVVVVVEPGAVVESRAFKSRVTPSTTLFMAESCSVRDPRRDGLEEGEKRGLRGRADFRDG